MGAGHLDQLRVGDISIGLDALSAYDLTTLADGDTQRTAMVTRGWTPARAATALEPVTIEVLKAVREQQRGDAALLGRGWTDTGLVFTRADGLAWHPGYVLRHFEVQPSGAGPSMRRATQIASLALGIDAVR